MTVLDPTGGQEGQQLWSSETHKKLFLRTCTINFVCLCSSHEIYWGDPPTSVCPQWQPQQWKDTAAFNLQLSHWLLDFNQEERVCEILELATSHNKPKQKPEEGWAGAGAKRAIARGNGLRSVSNNCLKGCHSSTARYRGLSGGWYKGKVGLKGLEINQLRNNFGFWWLTMPWQAQEQLVGTLDGPCYSMNSKHHMKYSSHLLWLSS